MTNSLKTLSSHYQRIDSGTIWTPGARDMKLGIFKEGGLDSKVDSKRIVTTMLEPAFMMNRMRPCSQIHPLAVSIMNGMRGWNGEFKLKGWYHIFRAWSVWTDQIVEAFGHMLHQIGLLKAIWAT